eukprot:gene19809-25753_t
MSIFGSFGTFISNPNKGVDDTIIDFNDRATLESFVSVIASLSAILSYGLITGGPVIIIWGWIITFIFTLIVVLCLAEICSAYPTAGGVYSWSGMIVPIKSSTIAAYICGWSNFIGNAAGDATFAYAFSDFLNAAINIQGGRNMTNFSAYDASGHLAEETSNARVNAPLAMIYTVITTGFVGLVYLLGLLFVLTMSEALNGPTTVAAVNIFMSITGKLYGSVLSWLIVGTLFLAGLSSVAITGRITYAMMRDGVFPHGKYWSEVHEISKSPYRCLLFAFIFNVFLLLLPLISQFSTDAYQSRQIFELL